MSALAVLVGFYVLVCLANEISAPENAIPEGRRVHGHLKGIHKEVNKDQIRPFSLPALDNL